MSLSKISHFDRTKINEKTLANMVAMSLQKKHENDSSVIKRIDQNIDVSSNIIYKWYRAEKSPKSMHLLKLAATYPLILKGILEMIGRDDIWQLCIAENIPEKMYGKLYKNGVKNPIYRVKNEPVNSIAESKKTLKLNNHQI